MGRHPTGPSIPRQAVVDLGETESSWEPASTSATSGPRARSRGAVGRMPCRRRSTLVGQGAQPVLGRVVAAGRQVRLEQTDVAAQARVADRPRGRLLDPTVQDGPGSDSVQDQAETPTQVATSRGPAAGRQGGVGEQQDDLRARRTPARPRPRGATTGGGTMGRSGGQPTLVRWMASSASSPPATVAVSSVVLGEARLMRRAEPGHGEQVGVDEVEHLHGVLRRRLPTPSGDAGRRGLVLAGASSTRRRRAAGVSAASSSSRWASASASIERLTARAGRDGEVRSRAGCAGGGAGAPGAAAPRSGRSGATRSAGRGRHAARRARCRRRTRAMRSQDGVWGSCAGCCGTVARLPASTDVDSVGVPTGEGPGAVEDAARPDRGGPRREHDDEQRGRDDRGDRHRSRPPSCHARQTTRARARRRADGGPVPSGRGPSRNRSGAGDRRPEDVAADGPQRIGENGSVPLTSETPDMPWLLAYASLLCEVADVVRRRQRGQAEGGQHPPIAEPSALRKPEPESRGCPGSRCGGATSRRRQPGRRG